MGVELDPGAGGATVATDTIAGEDFQYVKIVNGAVGQTAAVPADATNGLDVDVTRVQGTVTVAGTVTANLAAGTNNIGDVDVLSAPGQAADGAAALPAVLYVVGGWDGTNVQALSTDSSGLLQVDVVTAPTTAVTGPLTDAQLRASAVTVALQASDLTALETIQIGSIAAGDNNIGNVDLASAIPAGTNNIGDVDIASIAAGDNNIGNVDVVTLPGVAGTVAHDSADSGNPVKVGARARTSDVVATAADDRVDNIASILGKQVMLPYGLPGTYTKGTANSTGTSDTSVISAPGAGITLYITSLVITNAHATVGTKVQIKSGTTSTGYPRVFAAPNGGGAALTFPSPLKLAANEALQFACVTTGADVDVSAVGYTAAE